MNLFSKNTLQAQIIVVVGCLVLTRPAIAQGNDIREGAKTVSTTLCGLPVVHSGEQS